VTEDDWERGRGWALLLAVMFRAHCRHDERNRDIGERALVEVLAG
jgi:hypothetical protein